MPNTEYSQLKSMVEQLGHKHEITDRKINRLLTWAEGDKDLGTPSIKQQIDQNTNGITEVRKRTYENEDMIKDTKKDVEKVSDDVQNIKTHSAAIGMGGGGVVFTILETIKQWVGL